MYKLIVLVLFCSFVSTGFTLSSTDIKPLEYQYAMLFDILPSKADLNNNLIKIIYPHDKLISYKNTILVKGLVAPQVVKITVQGEDVGIVKNRFSKKVSFSEVGKQTVKILGYNKRGKLISEDKLRVLYMASFKDVKKSHPARRLIEELATTGLFSGFSTSIFRPEDILTRAQLAKILVGIGKKTDLRDIEAHFTDIGGHWAWKKIDEVFRKRQMIGFMDGTFRPDKKLSRVEATVALVRMDGWELPVRASKIFSDVPVDHWAAKYLNIAKMRGLVNGYSDGAFRPQKKMKRYELVQLIYNTEYAKNAVADLYDWATY